MQQQSTTNNLIILLTLDMSIAMRALPAAFAF
jgi:hypothetical protein